jgi:ATP/maltotriose-dependent transcriptional regulator MalT
VTHPLPALTSVLGRDVELSAIEAWLRRAAADPAANGRTTGVFVIDGEPGIGKTTLWAAGTHRARRAGWQVLTCRPVRSDAAMPHVALADLLRPVPAEAFGSLPGPQRRALNVALLREEAGDGDLEPRAVGTALTTLLGTVAEAGPLMLAADDAQWLDQASARALAFALRRLVDRKLAVMAAIRTEGPGTGRPGVFAPIESALSPDAPQRLHVGSLSVAAIHQLFQQSLGTSFPRPVLVKIHRAAGGNPFYAMEIGREVLRRGLPRAGQPLPVPDDHRELTLLRLRRLPPLTRDLLAAVAAMPSAAASDLDLAALAPAETAGIVAVRAGGRVEFTHPLFGSALYSSLPEGVRRDLHRQLAERTASPEERAWHLALAAGGPDDATAAELDRAAAVASARGAADVAVELTELAWQLTPAADREARVRRSIELAERRYFAGDPAGARKELEQTLQPLPEGEDRARVLLELGSVLWVQGEGEAGVAHMTQALAEARSTALRARIHSRISAESDDADIAVEHGEAALALMDEREDPQLYSFALHNLALFRLYAGKGADHEAIERGMQLQREVASWEMSTVPAFWARNFDDFDTAKRRFEDILRVLREQGDDATISGVLTHLARLEAMTGQMDRARALADEALDMATQTEQEIYINMALCAKGHVHAFAGEPAAARTAVGELLGRLEAHPDVVLEGMARIVLGLVALTGGSLAEADEQLSRADESEEALHHREPATARFHADHAEAVTGLGDLARADRLVQRMEARARAVPRPWIEAVSARCRGLLNAACGDLDGALADYERALAAHQTLDMPAEHGRTLLQLGRLLRRRNERQRAQGYLGQAVTLFESAGALGWAAIGQEELGRAHGRRGRAQQLTPTEEKICELAVSGLRNTEIAAQLFLAGKTVEANLSRAYRKLGIRSRIELAPALARASDPAGRPGDS